MRSALRRLGWGLVFPLVDLNLGSFDVFPDIIGYIMILIALRQLKNGIGCFKQASGLAATLGQNEHGHQPVNRRTVWDACFRARSGHSSCSARLYDFPRTIYSCKTNSPARAAGCYCHQEETLHGCICFTAYLISVSVEYGRKLGDHVHSHRNITFCSGVVADPAAVSFIKYKKHAYRSWR
jgi:hypothetical protein